MRTTGIDLLAIGETMAVVSPVGGARLSGNALLTVGPGGAESNVAATVAMLGHAAAWGSALGDDALGRVVLAGLDGLGVDTSPVRIDPARPTGVYFKDPTPAGTAVSYYRAGSAASALHRGDLDRWRALRPALVHVSGISAALSASCDDLLQALVVERALDATISFDVNLRPRLWATPAGPRLAELARHADIVFVGRDEAEILWGTTDAASIRELLPEPAWLVVKDAALEAVSFHDGQVTTMPSRPVEVLDAVGAGDAFAAGWLSGHLDGRDERTRLAIGHWTAAQALRSDGDVPAVPTAAEVLGLLGSQ